MRSRLLFPFLFIIIYFNSFGQAIVHSKGEGKLRKSDSPLSEIITLIPSGVNVKLISGPDKGIYFVEYNGQQGYLNELYLDVDQTTLARPYRGNSSYTRPSENKWPEYRLKDAWQQESPDEIEGIYESLTGDEFGTKFKLGVKKTSTGNYSIIYLTGRYNENSAYWSQGDLKALITSTATKYLFRAKWYLPDKSVSENIYVTFESGLMNTIWTDELRPKAVYLKIYPTADIVSNKDKPSVSGSGSGFAVSSEGYIATNFHVVANAKSINVRGINGDFSKPVTAKVVIEDRNNDLAIIKISDNTSTGLGSIPYVIQNTTRDVGFSIFCLGYPLRASMGDEVKLTNGIISSRTGYQGDVTAYQITAPIQPGNSGGPLLDEKGNVIGIINAKHTGADNVSYAIKSTYLLNLIENLPSPIRIQHLNLVAGKTLPEQVKLIRNFVYIIEVE